MAEQTLFDETHYSIIGKAGPELDDQLRLVTWHHGRVREAENRAEVLATPIREELATAQERVAELQGRLDEIASHVEKQTGFHRSAIEVWIADSGARETLGKTIPTAYGHIETRQVPGKTELDEAGLLRLAQSQPSIYGDLLKIGINAKVARERLRDVDGGTLDTVTGELIPENLIHVTEPPSIKVKLVSDSGV